MTTTYVRMHHTLPYLLCTSFPLAGLEHMLYGSATTTTKKNTMQTDTSTTIKRKSEEPVNICVHVFSVHLFSQLTPLPQLLHLIACLSRAHIVLLFVRHSQADAATHTHIVSSSRSSLYRPLTHTKCANTHPRWLGPKTDCDIYSKIT